VVATGWGGRYVSRAVKAVVERFLPLPEPVQWLPAELAPHLGHRGRAYWLLHVCKRAPLFDPDRSDWDPLPSKPTVPKRVRRMVLREADEGPLVRLDQLP